MLYPRKTSYRPPKDRRARLLRVVLESYFRKMRALRRTEMIVASFLAGIVAGGVVDGSRRWYLFTVLVLAAIGLVCEVRRRQMKRRVKALVAPKEQARTGIRMVEH